MKLKQNFQLHYIYSENETATKTQIGCTLIAQLLIKVIQKKQIPTKAFSTVAHIIEIQLIDMFDLAQTVIAKSKCCKRMNILRGSIFKTRKFNYHKL